MDLQEFQKHVKEFLLYISQEKNFAENTYRSYKTDLKQLTTFWQSLNKDEKQLLSLQTIVERYLVSLFYKKIKKSSIARKLSCLRSLELYLRKKNINLNIRVSRPKIERKLPIYLSIDEIFYLLDSIPEHELPSKFPIRDKAIFELLYATGVRCSELVAIRFNDIDMIKKQIRIMGKGKKERFVLFGEKAKKKIQEYIKDERPLKSSPADVVFLNHRNKPISTRSVQRIFQMFRSFLKTKKHITPHKIRHSFATHMLRQGTNLRIVQEFLGHKSLASTEKYTHISLQELTELCDQIHPFNKTIKPTS
jgi:integrase/recombinase XerC